MVEEESRKKKKIGKRGILGSVLGALVTLMVAVIANIDKISPMVETFVEQNYVIPDLTYVEKDGMIFFRSELKLQGAQLVLCPQILIRQGDDIIRMLNMNEICRDGELQYEEQNQGFSCEEIKWDEALRYGRTIKNELAERGYEVEIEEAVLLELTYKKFKNADRDRVYYILEDGIVTKEEERVVTIRGRAMDMTEGNWEQDYDIIIKNCMEILQDM